MEQKMVKLTPLEYFTYTNDETATFVCFVETMQSFERDTDVRMQQRRHCFEDVVKCYSAQKTCNRMLLDWFWQLG